MLLLSIPPELLIEIIQRCAQIERGCLRLTCKLLNNIADPLVFRHIRIRFRDPSITEHQLTALVTRASKACEFTREISIDVLPDYIRQSEQAPPHFGHCHNLRIHIPSAVSALRNLTRFSWEVSDRDPCWFINSLLQAVSRLPQLIELRVGTGNAADVRIPYSLFANLSRLSARCSRFGDIALFLSETASAIANSPQLRSLDVIYYCSPGSVILQPILNELFAKLYTESPPCLEHLYVRNLNATVDQVTLPLLAQLTSFRFYNRDTSIARSVWTSLMVNNIELTNVEIGDAIIEETMWYLSSFSGLKRLVLHVYSASTFPDVLYSEVLPKHINSLETLKIGNTKIGWVVFNHNNSKSILKCHKLRDLSVTVDGSISVQLLLDIVAHLPELKILRAHTTKRLNWQADLVKFKPSPGIRYVEELEIDSTLYLLEKEGGQPMRYREL